jgi:nucleoside-diphosphate-sugar epimerase
MKVLITGGTGYIGAALAARLAARGDEVTAFDIAPPRGETPAGARFVRGDLAVFSDVLDAVKACAPQRLFHLGSMLSAAAEQSPSASMRVNVDGTFHVLEAARLFGVERVVFASTYGTFGGDGGSVLGDATLQRPTLLYGCQKLFGEGLGRWYRRRYGLDFRALRYPQVVAAGIRTTWHWAPEMIEDALAGRPHASRWASAAGRNLMLSRDDAVRATLELMDAPADAIRTVCYNVAGVRQQVFAAEVADYLRRRCPGARIELPPGELTEAILAARETFDDARARAEWGWRPEHDTLEKIVDVVEREMAAG